MRLVDQKRTGLNPEYGGMDRLRTRAWATIPAVEALRDAGALVIPLAHGRGYTIELGDQMPAGIVAVHLPDSPYLGLRMQDEPEYPNEHPDYWQQVDWTPCPACGAPVVWYEAGYVPGYRVCTRPPFHHCLAK